MIINRDGDQYSIPKIDPCEAGTCKCCSQGSVSAKYGGLYAIRAGVGRVKTNKYAGKCVKCSARIEANAGVLLLANGKYSISHKKGDCNAS